MSKHTDNEYFAGKGCKCEAWGEHECGCEADWTDPRVYELLEALEKIAQPEGEYSRDTEQHQRNIIENCIAIATAAIAKAKGEA